MCDFYGLDHHVSAIKAIKKIAIINGLSLPKCYMFTDKAACELTWKFILPKEPMPLAVELLGLYDSWRYQGHKHEDKVLPFQYRMRILDLNPVNWSKCSQIWSKLFCNQTNLDPLIEEGRILVKAEQEANRIYCETYAFPTEIAFDNVSIKALAINSGCSSSLLFGSAWDEEKYDVMLAFCRRPDKKWNISLYTTKENIDCSKLVKYYGGGGHKSAAGFQWETLPFLI